MKNEIVLRVAGILLTLSASGFAAFGASEFPKAVKASSARMTSISPIAQPIGDLARPVYPANVAVVGKLDHTMLRISVNAQGAITDLMILKSSGSQKLDTVAADFARANWKFLPAARNGKAVPSMRVETITWTPPHPAN